MMSEVTMSDYDEVDGLYFPFSMTQGVKGQPGAPISISKIEFLLKHNLTKDFYTKLVVYGAKKRWAFD